MNDRGDKVGQTAEVDKAAADRKKADDLHNSYKRCVNSGHEKWLEEANKFDQFYIGEQWDPADLAVLAASSRPAITINTILSTVNTMIGKQTEQRVDPRIKPRRGGTSEVAATMAKVIDQIFDNNSYPNVESQAFTDGVITDRGYIDVRIGYDDHMGGEVEIKSRDSRDVLLDAEAKEYDPKTWSEVHTCRWMTPDEIRTTYGKEAGDRVATLGADETADYAAATIKWHRPSFGETEETGDGSDTSFDKRVKRILVVERQQRRVSVVEHFVDPETGDMRIVPQTWDDERRDEFAARAGLSLVKKPLRKIHWTVAAGPVLLHSEWSPYKRFTIIPYFPYFRYGKPFGVVRNLISPQELLNKAKSQELHVVNTTANSGYIVDDGALVNMTPEELATKGAQTGLVIVKAKDREIDKIQPNTVPSGLSELGRYGASAIREISGISDSLRGEDSAEVSGVAIKEKKQGGLVQMQVPFDNLAKTRQWVVEAVIDLVQQFYTETRVLQVIDRTDPAQEPQDLALNQPTLEGQMLNDMTLGEYGVVISTAPARDTYDETQFAEALELRNVGVMIPDDIIIQHSNLDNKRELADRVRQMNGMAEPSEEELAMQQQLQEIEMATAQSKLAELDAKVALMEADAQKAQVSAQKEGQELALETNKHYDFLKLEYAKLRQASARTIMELENKRDLAGIHTQSNRDGKAIDNLGKQTQIVIDGRQKLELAQKTRPSTTK